MWTCLCGAWNERERTHCAECGINTNEAAQQLANPRHESNQVEIRAILYGASVPVPDEHEESPLEHTPFDKF